MGKLFARAGLAVSVLGRSLVRAQEAARFIGAASVSERVARTDLVLLAVPDDAIAGVVASLSEVEGSLVVHLSGSLSSEVLAPSRKKGARTGALHPLRSFADPGAAAEAFRGTYCAVEGEASEELAELVRAIGGVPLRVRPEGKALYHAGAVFASNYLVASLEAALRLFEAAGISREEAAPALGVLAEGTIRNVSRIGIPAALSGPIERGDVATIRRHAEAMRDRVPALSGLYTELARVTCEVALAKGSIDRDRAGEVLGSLGEGRR